MPFHVHTTVIIFLLNLYDYLTDANILTLISKNLYENWGDARTRCIRRAAIAGMCGRVRTSENFMFILNNQN